MSKKYVYMTKSKADVRKSRAFRRGVPLGMKVRRSMTINFDLSQTIEHIEIECPDFKLTDRGPVLRKKKTKK